MARSVLIEGGVVANAIIGSLPGYQLLTAEEEAAGVSVGWTFDGAVFSAPERPAVDPQKVKLNSRVFWNTLRPALVSKGHILPVGQPVRDWLVAFITASLALTDDQKNAGVDALMSGTFERSDPYIDVVGALLGFSPSEVDSLFLSPVIS